MTGNRILLIEDNGQIMEGNRYFLSSRGYDVDTAMTLEAADAKLAKGLPNVIVLDIMLPDGSGLDFLARLRAVSDVPVLLLTGLSAPSDMVRGLERGGDDYLLKPYDFSVLLARIEALLRRARKVPDSWEKGVLRLDIVSS